MPMSPARKLWCRTYQAAFRIVLPILPYYEPKRLDSTARIPGLLTSKNIASVLVVTDPGVYKLGLTRPLEDALANAGIAWAVYAKTVANPTISNVEEAAGLYRERGCQAIVGFGGGSAMDCAKGVGARIAQPRKPIQKMRGLLRVHRRLPLLIAVPTTAGTGSETTLAAVITDEATHYKYPINDFALIPRYAVLDPELTLGLPAQVTATTGMDALTHAVEAYVGRSTNAYTRRMAVDAVRLIHGNLLSAYRNGGELDARRAMLEAAYKAGCAFTRSYVGYVHAILPHVLRAYGSAAERRLADLARKSGVVDPSESDADAAAGFIRWVDSMNASMGIPSALEGIRDEDIPTMAAHADAEANPLYPVPVLWDADELAAMYRKIRA